MASGRFKPLSVLAFSLLLSFFSYTSFAQQNPDGDNVEKEDRTHHASDEKGGAGHGKKKAFDANEVIFGHVMDAHEFHFFSWEGADGKQHHATIPLPVLLFEPGRGF